MGKMSPPHKTLAVCFALMCTVGVAGAVKVIVLFAPCEESVTNILHLVRKSVAQHLAHRDEDHRRVHFKNRGTRSPRHDLSDACHWVSEGTVAVLAVTSSDSSWEGIDTNAHAFKLPHLITSETCSTPCGPSTVAASTLLELAIFEYLKDEYLHDVLMLHEGDGSEGFLLSYLLSSNSVRMSHLQATEGQGFLKTVEHYFDTWNMADLTDEGRLLVSLGGGDVSDQLLKKQLMASSMHNMRMKILVVGGLGRWQGRLLEVKAYEVDLVVISGESVSSADCPVAVEILPTGYHGHESDQCDVLPRPHQDLGKAILRDVQEDLRLRRCCATPEQYTVWKSFPSENGTQKLRPVAAWANDTGLLRMETLDLETVTLRIAVVQYLPYVNYSMTNGEVILGDCVLKEIIEFLSERLNFRYRLLEAPEDDWGTKIGSEWRGAIGMVVRGEADMIPYLTITPSRYHVIEYSKPLATVRYGLLIAFPAELPRAFIFLRLYKKEVWILIFLTALVLSCVLCKMHNLSFTFRKPEQVQKKLCSFFRCLWLIFGILLQQGGTHLPLTTSGRLLLVTWWLSVMVITTTYSANLIAFLAIPEIRFIVSSLEDMLIHRTITLIIKEGCPVLEDLEQSEVELYRRIREVYLQNPLRYRKLSTHTKRCCAIDEVAAGRAVYIDDLNYLSWMVEQDYQKHGGHCRVTVPPYEFTQMELAVALRRGSSLLEPLNDEIQQMKESGVLKHWKKKYSPPVGECYGIEASQPGQREVNLEDLQGPFYLLLLGVFFGFLLFGAEATFSKLKRIIRKYDKSLRGKRWQYERHQLSFF